MKSDTYVELQFQIKEAQDWIDELTMLIARFELNNDDFRATEIRKLRDGWIKKAKAAQNQIDYEQMELGL